MCYVRSQLLYILYNSFVFFITFGYHQFEILKGPWVVGSFYFAKNMNGFVYGNCYSSKAENQNFVFVLIN